MKLITPVIGVLVVLAFASPAAAKNITKAQACGEDACVALQNDQVMQILNSGGSVSQPPPTAPYIRLDFTFDAGGPEANTFSHLFVPSSGLIGANGETQQAMLWFRNDAEITAGLRDVVRELEPFAAPIAWPANLDATEAWTSYAPIVDAGTNWRPWALATGAIMIALSAGGLLARRLRVRRPTTA